ncbi:hypothetical protein EZS27_002298 [termite gut metagenome]|uniref:DUF5119 domain-containing protein n=1 Tax=termite gut metagenome TaxID=433724 RepID=A0A5J4SX37_9ZZZZ
MLINKWLLLLVFIGVCAACTNEAIDRRKEGEVTIIPLWEEYKGSFLPDKGIKYYFYNIDNHSNYPIEVSTMIKEESIIQILPVGVYQLVGYNMDFSKDLLTLSNSANFTVVANFQPYPFSTEPLNLCIISSNEIIVENRGKVTQEIVPIEVKTKSLTLKFIPEGIQSINKITGKLDGAFATINLVNGKALEDISDILFQADYNNTVEFRISDIYLPSQASISGSFPSYKQNMLSLTVEVINDDGTIISKTGECNLNVAIEQAIKDNITVDVHIKDFPTTNRVLLSVY